MQTMTLNEAPQDLLSVINRVNIADFTPSSSRGRRKPSAKIAGKGEILGDIITL